MDFPQGSLLLYQPFGLHFGLVALLRFNLTSTLKTSEIRVLHTNSTLPHLHVEREIPFSFYF